MRWVPLRDLQEVVTFFTIVILTSLRNLSACKSSFFSWVMPMRKQPYYRRSVFLHNACRNISHLPLFNPLSCLPGHLPTVHNALLKVRFQREILNRNCDFRTHYWYMEYVDSILCHFAETSSDLRVRLPLRNDLSPTTAIRLQTHYYFNCILRI